MPGSSAVNTKHSSETWRTQMKPYTYIINRLYAIIGPQPWNEKSDLSVLSLLNKLLEFCIRTALQ